MAFIEEIDSFELSLCMGGCCFGSDPPFDLLELINEDSLPFPFEFDEAWLAWLLLDWLWNESDSLRFVGVVDRFRSPLFALRGSIASKESDESLPSICRLGFLDCLELFDFSNRVEFTDLVELANESESLKIFDWVDFCDFRELW